MSCSLTLQIIIIAFQVPRALQDSPFTSQETRHRREREKGESGQNRRYWEERLEREREERGREREAERETERMRQRNRQIENFRLDQNV